MISTAAINATNSPDSLLLSCVKFVVRKEIDIQDVSLPQEICDLLLEVIFVNSVYYLPNWISIFVLFLFGF